MAKRSFNFKRVYIWELPVRVFHWITVAATLILIITGFIIANPPALIVTAEATELFNFGLIRAIHMITAYVLVANLIFRVYWTFAGNEFAHWRNFIPLSKKAIKNIIYVLKVDILLMKDKEHKLSNISIGHNHLAAFSYLIMTLLFLVQVATGFALMEPTSNWWFPKLFSFITPLFGGDIKVRYFHHIATWVFMAFIVVHVYLVLYHDYLEARGEASAMISGYKFIRSERTKMSEEEVKEASLQQMRDGTSNETKPAAEST